ncbi:hypothetical protein L1887_60420 [Cichorium endivia]|nr:hypothetical protein L1887_60420 [Cichorium endivia]
MKGATVTNNRSRIARHCPTSKQKPFCHGEKWEWNLNITTGIVIRDCQPEPARKGAARVRILFSRSSSAIIFSSSVRKASLMTFSISS